MKAPEQEANNVQTEKKYSLPVQNFSNGDISGHPNSTDISNGLTSSYPNKDLHLTVMDVVKPMSKLRIVKNLFILCIGYLLLFTAYEALANLQSTMNSENSIGTLSQAVMYTFFNISSFVLPTFVIKRLGCKVTLILCILGFCPYIAANFYPTWGTLIPSAVLCGIVAGPLWSARSTYVNEISFQFATYSKESVDVITALFFGICCMFYQNTQIWGNLISYYVLRPKNSSFVDVSTETLSTCGACFCNEIKAVNDSNPNLDPPTDEKRYMLIAIYLSCSIFAAVVIWLLLDPLTREEDKKEENASLSPALFFATLKHLKKRRQLLLLPLTFYFGLGDGFYVSDFTKAYIACAWGVHHVGFVMICFGVVSALTSLASGPMVKYLSRPLVFLSAALSNVVVYVVLLFWRPHPEEPLVFFLIAGAWGYGDAVWWAQITGIMKRKKISRQPRRQNNRNTSHQLSSCSTPSSNDEVMPYRKETNEEPSIEVISITAVLDYLTDVEYRRLQSMVPSVAKLRQVSKVTLLKEATMYIQCLHQRAVEKLKSDVQCHTNKHSTNLLSSYPS